MSPTTAIGVNRCIYCGATRYDATRPNLAEEHVIPLSLDGHLIIPNASCGACEKAINRFETPSAKKIFGPIRYYLGLQTRNPKQRPEHLPVILTYKEGRKKIIEILLSQHPTIMCLETLEPPGFLSFLPKRGRQVLFIMPCGMKESRRKGRSIADSWKAVSCRTESSFNFLHFARLLAKISYCYVVSNIGTESFQPLLLDVILKGSTEPILKYIGCDHRPLQTPLGLHELNMESAVFEGATLIVVRVRLFSYLLAPEYVVAVGRLNPGEPIPKGCYTERGPALSPGSRSADVQIVRPMTAHPLG